MSREEESKSIILFLFLFLILCIFCLIGIINYFDNNIKKNMEDELYADDCSRSEDVQYQECVDDYREQQSANQERFEEE